MEQNKTITTRIRREKHKWNWKYWLEETVKAPINQIDDTKPEKQQN